MRTLALLAFAVVASLPACWSAPAVRLLSNLSSPQSVGTVFGLTAIPKEEGEPLKLMGKYRFRYSVSVDGAAFRVVRDYSPQQGFAWRPELFEHDARVKVTMKNVTSKLTAEAELPFRVVARAVGQKTVVTPTANPLVALFSAPPCPEGSRFRVMFRREGEAGKDQRTGSQPCTGSRTNNIYVAGMLADSAYEMRAEVVDGDSAKPGPPASFHTGIVDGNYAPFRVVTPRDAAASSAEQFLVYSIELPVQRPIATDLSGNLVWYLPLDDRSLTRMLPGGRFLVFNGGINEENSRRAGALGSGPGGKYDS
ncbi:MAG: hypothetical protein QM757_39455 [Paludibaculum sp.]